MSTHHDCNGGADVESLSDQTPGDFINTRLDCQIVHECRCRQPLNLHVSARKTVASGHLQRHPIRIRHLPPARSGSRRHHCSGFLIQPWQTGLDPKGEGDREQHNIPSQNLMVEPYQRLRINSSPTPVSRGSPPTLKRVLIPCRNYAACEDGLPICSGGGATAVWGRGVAPVVSRVIYPWPASDVSPDV